MQFNIILLASFLMMIKIGVAVVYNNNTVVNEKVLLYKNPRFSLKVIGEGEDSQLFMTIRNTIREQDNLLIDVIVVRSDGVTFSIEDDVIRLCQLLSDEATGRNEKITQFRLSRAFSLEEMKCPIQAGTKRLMPYMFPLKLSLQNDIGCGTFTYKATIMSCQGQKSDDCVPYITASTDVYLHGDHCSNTLM